MRFLYTLVGVVLVWDRLMHNDAKGRPDDPNKHYIEDYYNTIGAACNQVGWYLQGHTKYSEGLKTRDRPYRSLLIILMS